MELGNILNTKIPAQAIAGRPIRYDMQHNMQHDLQQQHFGPTSYLNGRIKSENGSDRGVSPHPSEHSSRYSSQAPQPLQSYPPMSNNMNGMRYPSPSQMQTPMPLLNNNNYIPNPPDHTYPQQAPPDQQNQQTGGRPASDTGPPKAFACSTCGKGFARRSDLARHGRVSSHPEHTSLTDRTLERIHSGVRPHVCDYPGCGKQFIQRSALTVHQRVHTGEKPHMCERCGKV